MTTAIEVTKREMYEKLKAFRCCAVTLETLEESFEAHLEALRQDHAAPVTERDTLRNRVQVLEMANKTSGEVIRGLKREAEQARKALMVARLTEFAAQVSSEKENASCATCGGSGLIYTLPMWGVPQMKPAECPTCSKKPEEPCAHSYANQHGCPECGEKFNACQHSFHYAHEHCIYCGVRK